MFARPGGFFGDVMRMQHDIDQLFGTSRPSGIRSARQGAYPAINVGANSDQVDVYVFAAGLNLDELDLSIQQNLLTISGKRNLITEEGGDYYRRERFDGDFRRVVTLPDDVDPDKVEAQYRDGVLRISIQRHETAKSRKIEVK